MPSRNTIKQLDTVKTRKEFLPSLVVVTVQVAWIIMVIQFPWLSCKKDYQRSYSVVCEVCFPDTTCTE